MSNVNVNYLRSRVFQSNTHPLCNQENLHANATLYMNFLQLCIDKSAERGGRSIHNHIITNGFESNLHLNTKLIIFYTRVGELVEARKVFDKMPDRSVVSWTAMISGYSQKGFCYSALLVFQQMVRAGVKANQFTYGSALRACTGLRCLREGVQIQGYLQKGRFADNLFVKSALLHLHAKCGKLEDARFLFDTMIERDVVSWNAMIGGYVVQGFAHDSFLLFKMMMNQGKNHPDCFTFGNVLKGFARGSDLMKVRQLHALIIRLGFGSYNTLTGSLIDAYAKCQCLASAYRLYKSMVRKDVISCTALITGFTRQVSYTSDAFDLFKEIVVMQIAVDDVILSSMLNICANTASLSVGRQLHAFSLKCQSSSDVAMGNALIDMYAKCGVIEDAHRAFHGMEDKNVITWTSMIAAYGKHGYGDKAIGLYDKMEYEGLKPNDVTFLSLLFACSHTGLTDIGWNLFNTMVSKYNILPRHEHLSCIIDLFARAGQFEKACTLICEMNIKPTPSLWGALLGACQTHGNISIGEVAAMHLFDLEPHMSVNYVVLASMYSAVGAWDSAKKTWKQMEERGSLKNPGYSRLSHMGKKMELLQP